MNNKLTTTISSLTIMGLLVASPLAAFAKDGDVKTPKVNPGTNFCTTINSEDFKALTKFGDNLIKRDGRIEDRDTKIEDRRGMFDQKREDKKSEFENKQDERGLKLEGKSLTDEQRAVLAAAQLAVQNAVDLKNVDVAALVAEFRTNMDGIRSEHRSEIDALLGDVKVDIDAAITKAKADCAAGVAPETVKANFQASIKTTHEAFAADRKVIQEQTKTEVKTEVESRKEDRSVVRESFRASMKSAWESFKSLFNKKAQ